MLRNKKIMIAPLGLLGFTVLSGAFLMSNNIFADDSQTSNVSVNVPVACTMTGTGMNSHNATIPNGTYQDNIGTTTMKAVCNDNNGFAIYAIGYTDNEYGKTVLTNSTLGTSADIATGTATSTGSPDVSNWAMKLATNTSATYPLTLDNSFGSYHNVPTEYTKVAHRDSGTDMGTSAVGSELTSTYAAYMSKTQPAGTYIGQVKYTLVHPSTHEAPVACNNKATTISEAVCLQDFAHVSETNRNSIIASMTPEQQYTLKDSRDGKTYTIAKYQVDNDNYDVWMTQNLDLDLVAGETYTNMDTDIGYDDATNTYNTASWSPIRSTYSATSTHTHAWCEGGTWNSQYNHCDLNNTPESYDPGDLYWNATESNWDNDWSAYNISCAFNTNTPVCDQTRNPISNFISTTSSTPQYRLGNYYNWAAALATNDSSVYNSGYPPEQSICPAGWTLPKDISGNGTFYKLWNQYGFTNTSINGSNKLWTNPLYFVLGGAFEDGYLRDLGSDGPFWSSTPNGSLRASGAFFGASGYAYSSGAADRYNGLSVRCLVRQVYNSGSGGEVQQ